MSYTVWWDMAHDVILRHPSHPTADELGNVFVSDVPSRELAKRIGQAFRDELANLGHKIHVAVSD